MAKMMEQDHFFHILCIEVTRDKYIEWTAQMEDSFNGSQSS